MGLKDMNFKQLLLEKGERIGLGAALGCMGLLLVFGLVSGLGGGTASGTQSDIDKERQSAKTRIDNAAPDPSDSQKDQKELVAQVTFDALNPDTYRVANNFFTPSSIEDTKRRNPDILDPTEFKAELVLAPIKSVMIPPGAKHVGVLVDKQNPAKGGLGNYGNRMRGPGAMSGLGGRGGMGMPGMGGGTGSPDGGTGSPDGGDGGGGMASMGGRGGMPGGMMGGSGESSGGRKPLALEFVEFDKLEKRTDVRLAETIEPRHLALVTGSFPLKQQWEEFRRALRKRDLVELAALNQSGEATFQFDGIELRRRVLFPDGKVKDDWIDYTKRWNDELRALFIRAVDFDEDDPKLQFHGFVVDGLTGAMPKLARDMKYPEVNLEKVNEAIKTIEKEFKEGQKLFQPKTPSKFKGDNFDPFSARGFKMDPQQGGTPNNPYGGTGGTMPAQGGTPGVTPGGRGGVMGPGGSPDGGTMYSEPTIPEQAVLRFIDPSVQPGYTYQYQVKVRMVNPNYERKDVAFKALAKPEKLSAKDWGPNPPVTLHVPTDSPYYVVDQKTENDRPMVPPADKDRLPVQIHRWVSRMLTNADNSDSALPFGSWSIMERQLFQRGDYLRRLVESDVPVWEPTLEEFVMAKSSRKGGKVQVEYSSRAPFTQTPAVLVDFEGGNNFRTEIGSKDGPKKGVTDTSPLRALILSPEGKLIVRDSQDDTENEARKKRIDDWRKWLKDVKAGKRDPMKQGGGLFGPGGPGGGEP